MMHQMNQMNQEVGESSSNVKSYLKLIDKMN